MTRWEKRFVYLATILVGGTGLIYAVMRYLLEPADPYAVVNHPWQPFVQHLHVLSAPLLVFAAGLLWRRHVVEGWKSGRPRRRSGVAQVLTLVPMIASGYLIQTTVSDGWRNAWIAVHLITAAVWLAAFGVHYAASYRDSRFARRQLRETLGGRWRRSTETRSPG